MAISEVKHLAREEPRIKIVQLPAPEKNWKDFHWAIGILGFVFAVRGILLRNLPLTGDEAYYWEWSRHLAFGYHDHPPLVGWLIAGFSLFGKSAFWVRFPSLALSAGSGVFLFSVTNKVWRSGRNALFAVLLFSTIPVFSICSLAIFPDAPLVFCWSFFLWAGWEWLADEKKWPWIGLSFGLACLSKLMGVFLFPSFLLFLAVSKPHRKLLKRSSLWAAAFLSGILVAPFLYWNARHHFETFLYQFNHRITAGISFSPGYFLNYAVLQAASLSPLGFALIIAAVVFLFSRARGGDSRAIFSLCMALPIHAFFIAASFFTRIGLHWALPGYLSILSAIPFYVDVLRERGRGWARPLFFWAVLSAGGFTLLLYAMLGWPQSLIPKIGSLGLRAKAINNGKTVNTQTLAEILGYPELGNRVKKELARASFAFTDSYSLSSVIGFYAGTDAKTLLFTSTGGEFSRWNHFDRFLWKDALYVDTQPIGSRPDIDAALKKAFVRVEPLPPLTVKRGGLSTGTFYFALCRRLTDPAALTPPWPW